LILFFCINYYPQKNNIFITREKIFIAEKTDSYVNIEFSCSRKLVRPIWKSLDVKIVVTSIRSVYLSEITRCPCVTLTKISFIIWILDCDDGKITVLCKIMTRRKINKFLCTVYTSFLIFRRKKGSVVKGPKMSYAVHYYWLVLMEKLVNVNTQCILVDRAALGILTLLIIVW